MAPHLLFLQTFIAHDENALEIQNIIKVALEIELKHVVS